MKRSIKIITSTATCIILSGCATPALWKNRQIEVGVQPYSIKFNANLKESRIDEHGRLLAPGEFNKFGSIYDENGSGWVIIPHYIYLELITETNTHRVTVNGEKIESKPIKSNSYAIRPWSPAPKPGELAAYNTHEFHLNEIIISNQIPSTNQTKDGVIKSLKEDIDFNIHNPAQIITVDQNNEIEKSLRSLPRATVDANEVPIEMAICMSRDGVNEIKIIDNRNQYPLWSDGLNLSYKIAMTPACILIDIILVPVWAGYKQPVNG